MSGTVIAFGGAAASPFPSPPAKQQQTARVSSTQRCVTLSTEEAEYVALGEGVKEPSFPGAVLS